MPISRSRLPVSWLAALAWLAGPAPVAAHPHVWIDTTATFHFDGQQRIVAIEARWVFDDMYSVYEVEGRDADRDGRVSAEELVPLAAENAKQLKEWGYFSVLKVDGKRVFLDAPASYGISYDGKFLNFTMTLPLAHPVDPRRSLVRFSMFDPTFYIELVPAKDNPVYVKGAAPPGCAAKVERLDGEQPSFVPDEQAATSRIDPDDPEVSVGADFAEWIEFSCGNPS